MKENNEMERVENIKINKHELKKRKKKINKTTKKKNDHKWLSIKQTINR